MGLSSNQSWLFSSIYEIRNQTKYITIATHFVLHQLNWVKLDYRKVKFLTIDFTEGVIPQPLA